MLDSPNVGACNKEQLLKLLKDIQSLTHDEKVNYASELERLLTIEMAVKLRKDGQLKESNELLIER